MRIRLFLAMLPILVPAAVGAQTMVTLDEAMTRARADTPRARALGAAVAEAAARVGRVRSGFLPRVDVTESVHRGNDPVYVFSTLLSQRRFAAANFDIQRLNDPAPETNIRTAIVLDQQVYDAGTRLDVQAAELEREVAALDQVKGGQDLAFDAARSFVRVLHLEAAERASAAAATAAESDLQRVRQRRDVGLVTDADVLAIEVHRADVRQRYIAITGDLAVARIELAEALGLPLDQPVILVKPALPSLLPDTSSAARQAIDTRPESRQAALQVQLADNGRRLAQAAFLPRVGVEASWALNGSSFLTQRSGWTVGTTLQLNLFNGLADRARVTEAREAATRAAAERERIARRIEVEVRGAAARVAAARARETAGRTALAQARESQRIIRDRYAAGLASVTDVLRAAEAVFDAEARATAAEMDVILETVALDRAAGRL
jgi:outer membrane protein TolC